MIRHIVLFDFLEKYNGQCKMDNAIKAKELLLNLEEKVDVLKHIEVGINAKDAEQKNFTLSLICDFESFEDLQIYQNHPEHVKVASFLANNKVSRSCVDYEI